MLLKALTFFLLLLSCMSPVQAEPAESTEYIISGFAYYQIGKLMHVTPQEGLLKKPFDQHFNGRLTLKARVNERLDIVVGGEMELGVNIFDQKQKKQTYLKEAQGMYSFGDLENPFLQIAAGYFPFKYSTSQNLGEYLLRSGTYPGFVITDFDFAKSRLMGFRVSGNLFDKLKLDVLFTSEYNVRPYFDYSLSFLAGVKPLENGLIDLGAGIMLDRLIPVKEERTTKPGNIVQNEFLIPVIEDGDTLRYTLRGTKLMARAAIDPKPLMPFAELLGTEDLKIYGEIAVLGYKNYLGYYEDRKKRVPIMFGFNWLTHPLASYTVTPAALRYVLRNKGDIGFSDLFHKSMLLPLGAGLVSGYGLWWLEKKFEIKTGLDVLAVEFEYYPTDSTKKMDIPTDGNPFPAPYAGKKMTQWKWSVYAKKTIIPGVRALGLVGRDHYRFVGAGGNYDPIERMNGPKDWHYKLRLMFSF